MADAGEPLGECVMQDGVTEDDAMEDGVREDEEGTVEDGVRMNRAVAGVAREDGTEAWEDGGVHVRGEREGGRSPVVFQGRAREGHSAYAERIWSIMSWKTLLVVTASLGIGALLFILYKQHKRIKALEEVMAVTKIKFKTESVPKLNPRIGMLEHQMFHMKSRMDALNTATNNINGKLAATSSKIDNINGKFAATSSKIDNIIGKFAATSSKIDNIIGKLAATSSKIDDMEKAMNEISANLVNTQRFVVDMAQRQKWPWPFNNRVKGLEEEFGLPKK